MVDFTQIEGQSIQTSGQDLIMSGHRMGMHIKLPLVNNFGQVINRTGESGFTQTRLRKLFS